MSFNVELTSFRIPNCLVEDFCGIHPYQFESNYDYNVAGTVDKMYQKSGTYHDCFEDINVCSSFSFVKRKEVKFIDPILLDRLRKSTQ
jgi:hypothetical protein